MSLEEEGATMFKIGLPPPFALHNFLDQFIQGSDASSQPVPLIFSKVQDISHQMVICANGVPLVVRETSMRLDRSMAPRVARAHLGQQILLVG